MEAAAAARHAAAAQESAAAQAAALRAAQEATVAQQAAQHAAASQHSASPRPSTTQPAGQPAPAQHAPQQAQDPTAAQQAAQHTAASHQAAAPMMHAGQPAPAQYAVQAPAAAQQAAQHTAAPQQPAAPWLSTMMPAGQSAPAQYAVQAPAAAQHTSQVAAAAQHAPQRAAQAAQEVPAAAQQPAQEAAAAQRIQASYRGHAVRRGVALQRLVLRQRSPRSPSRPSSRSALELFAGCRSLVARVSVHVPDLCTMEELNQCVPDCKTECGRLPWGYEDQDDCCMFELHTAEFALAASREAATNTEAPPAAAMAPADSSRVRPVYSTVPVRAALPTQAVSHLGSPDDGLLPAQGPPAVQHDIEQGTQSVAAGRGASLAGQQQHPPRQDQGMGWQHAAAAPAFGAGAAPDQVAALERLRADMLSSVARAARGSCLHASGAHPLEQCTWRGSGVARGLRKVPLLFGITPSIFN